MIRSKAAWYVVAAVVVGGPVGLRMQFLDQNQCVLVRLSCLRLGSEQARAGELLFTHEWQPRDPLSPGGDGLGPVYNARSCVACHHQGGVGGSGGLERNVTSYLISSPDLRSTPREGVLHAHATSPQYRETLAHLDPGLPGISQVWLSEIVPSFRLVLPRRRDHEFLNLPANIRLSQRNTPALFGARQIDEIPDGFLIAEESLQRVRFNAEPGHETLPIGRVSRLPNGRIGRFGWKGQTASLSDFVQGACANELGLGNPGQDQPQTIADPGYRPAGFDLTQVQCDQLTAFVASLNRPVERRPTEPDHAEAAEIGKMIFTRIGCAECHTPNLGPLEGLYSDLMLHRMGPTLESGTIGYYRGDPAPTILARSPPAAADEWRTPPLWGVADSAPYLHDGRAATLEEAIQLHGGQGEASARNYERLGVVQRGNLFAFLRTLRAP
jgi:CxxC motif-containing protein (DUF1111 family)